MFELQILFANILVPAIIFVSAYAVTLQLPNSMRAQFQPPVVAMSGALALWLAFALRNGWSLWPEDVWQRIPVASLLVAVVTAVTEIFLHPRGIQAEAGEAISAPEQRERKSFAGLEIMIWLLRAVAIAQAALIIFPTGESWVELQSMRRWWIGVITVGVSFGWYSISRCRTNVAPIVGFALIPWTVAAAFLISQSFMKVTEPMLAIATLLALASLFDWKRRTACFLNTISGVTLFTAAAAIAQGQFYSYLDLPRNLYAIAILTPLLIALAARLGQLRSTRVGQAMAIVISLALTAVLLGIVSK